MNIEKVMHVAGLLAFIGAGVWFFVEQVDPRYVHAGEFQKFRSDIMAAQTRQRAQYLDDQIFELRLKVNNGTATATDKALLNRFTGEVNRIYQQDPSVIQGLGIK